MFGNVVKNTVKRIQRTGSLNKTDSEGFEEKKHQNKIYSQITEFSCQREGSSKLKTIYNKMELSEIELR